MKRKWLVIYFSILSSIFANKVFAVEASLCQENGTTVFFGNGIFTTEISARNAAIILQDDLREALSDSPDEYLKYNFSVAYNRTDGFVKDVFEVVRQDIGAKTSMFIRLFGNTLNTVDKLLLDAIPDIFANALSSVASEFDKNAISISDVKNHVDLYKARIKEGQKIIVVPHSQGNFFVNSAYLHLTDEERVSFGIVSVANPDSKVAGNWPYTTSHADVIIKVIPTALSSNTSNGFHSDDVSGHFFIDSYLRNGAASKNIILNDIVSVNNAIVQPQILANRGVITATLTWGNEPDVDLHVYEPNGTHVYWRNKSGSSGLLDVDDVDGEGPEHYSVLCGSASVGQFLQEGTYRVGVNYYRGQLPETAKVVLQVGNNFIVRQFNVDLPVAYGSLGDNSPILVADIEVFANPDGSFDFSIQ